MPHPCFACIVSILVWGHNSSAETGPAGRLMSSVRLEVWRACPACRIQSVSRQLPAPSSLLETGGPSQPSPRITCQLTALSKQHHRNLSSGSRLKRFCVLPRIVPVQHSATERPAVAKAVASASAAPPTQRGRLPRATARVRARRCCRAPTRDFGWLIAAFRRCRAPNTPWRNRGKGRGPGGMVFG
jgi:hypothetical protein